MTLPQSFDVNSGDMGFSRRPCACGTPSKANFYTRVIYTDDNGETTYSDMYTCTEHTDPWIGDSQDTPGTRHLIDTPERLATWSEHLGEMFSVPAESILEVEQTELR